MNGVAADHFGQTVSNSQIQYLLSGLFNERTGKGYLAALGSSRQKQAVKGDNRAYQLGKLFEAHQHFIAAKLPGRLLDAFRGVIAVLDSAWAWGQFFPVWGEREFDLVLKPIHPLAGTRAYQHQEET